jgi:hypothetical protein
MADSGLPKPALRLATMRGGEFVSETWSLSFSAELLAVDNPSPEAFAQTIGLMRHELEHGLQFFRIARQEAASGQETPRQLSVRLFMPVKEVAAAIEANTGQRPAEDMAPGSPVAIATRSHFESMYGATGAQHRTAVYAKVNPAWEAIDRAKANFDRVRTERPESLRYQVAQREWHDAWLANEPAIEEYHQLPEEIAAYKAGDELTQAVRERGVLARLERAQAAERRAYETFQPLEELAASVRDKPGQTLALDVRQAFNKALGEWMGRMHLVRRLEQELMAVRRVAQP